MAGFKVARFAAESADREAIRDCLFRYCRGIDRCDAELLRSVYWDDAVHDHGVFKAARDEFIELALKSLGAMDQTQHLVGNILIEIDGADARVESYIQAFHRLRRPDGRPHDMISCGRYIDRLERRDDEWRIVHRLFVRDWFREYDDSADWEKGPLAGRVNRGARKPDDRSYEVLTR